MPKGPGKVAPDSTLVQKATARVKGTIKAAGEVATAAKNTVAKNNPFKRIGEDLDKLGK